MRRVTGIGGVFFRSENPEKLQEWYIKYLGVPFVTAGSEKFIIFHWKEQMKNEKNGYTLWGPMSNDHIYFKEYKKDVMFNFTVDNLDELLKVLRDEGVHVFEEIEEHQEGRFGWILDPERNKVELWEPPKKET